MFENLKDQSAAKSDVRRDENSVCEFCFGTGTYLDPVKGARKCDCRKVDERQRLLAAARIPERYRHCTLNSFQVPDGNQSIEWAHEIAKAFVREHFAMTKGLLFVGDAGVGKTHLAVGIIKELIQQFNRPCLFYECGALLKEIQNSYSDLVKTSELGLLAPVYEAKVLVLDELGTVVPTGWVFDTLYQIINTRYNQQKLTIFTSNYRDEPRLHAGEDEQSSSRTFSTKKSASIIEKLTTLEERISSRVRSRLHEMCTMVVMEGDDYRKHMGRRRFDASR